MKPSIVRHVIASAAILVVMILFSACAGVGNSNNSQQTMSGSVVSVNPTTHTVVLNVGGQTETITNVPTNVLTLLQGQVGHVYSVDVTTNSDGTFSLVSGTDATPEVGDTPTTNETSTPTTAVQGSIEFIGTLKVTSSSSIVVSMPDGSQISMSLNNTDLSDFNNSMPNIGTQVSVKASTNPDGSFNAESLSTVKSSDNTGLVTYKGVTTAAVGSDNSIHFQVGTQGFTFTISSTTDLGDFNNNAQSIQSGAAVKVEVQFNGNTSTVVKVSNNGN